MKTTPMDSSDKRESLSTAPACSHRLPFLHNRHRQCLELSPHCPQHGGYLLHPNNHQHHSAPARGHHHHHHHHLELSPDCPLHGHLLPKCPLHSSNFHSSNQPSINFPIIRNFASIPLPRTPHLSNPDVNKSNSIPPETDANSKSEALIMQEITEEVEEEDEEEIIFVLTDEWKEFFAKSEAKRRLAKKQAKKKGKD